MQKAFEVLAVIPPEQRTREIVERMLAEEGFSDEVISFVGGTVERNLQVLLSLLSLLLCMLLLTHIRLLLLMLSWLLTVVDVAVVALMSFLTGPGSVGS